MKSWVSSSSFAWISVVLLASSSPLLTRAQVPASEGLCTCPFAADNEKDCSVYGPNPDGDGLVAYPRIGDECIENIGARSSFLPALDFWIYCPYRNGTKYNLDGLESQDGSVLFVLLLFH